MPDTSTRLKQPPWLHTPEGALRRVGVELEMGGIELDVAAGCIANLLSGEIASKGRYERSISGDPAGDWIVELDFDLLKRMGREQRDPDSLADGIERGAEDVLAWAAEAVVPLEVVSPPLPLDQLERVEGVIRRLREAGALGTSDNLVYAFGMQFNPELPATDARLIASCIKAFLCSYEWLLARADVDSSRRITSYVNPFPYQYLRKVIDPSYWPDRESLIDDYLADNPTRNRALDMLPLFLHLDEKRVRSVTDDPLIKARPTFHYRLPNCDIHKPEWNFADAWNDWVQVERLAADSDALNALCSNYQNFLEQPMKRWFGNWSAQFEKQWLNR